ncbi:hypothetical protein ACI3LY_003618 [Candidozyma auris]|uniref:Histone chaperone RTT106 n=2 Tax=Candidozyma auris TaxID=498019 RepID=A0A2H0ZXM7_CANAR|nr:hypothetical_protein [[Candida] auris]KNE02623.2 hypothetical protein QG37_00440 [[Candida] auris]PIS55012.1 hypothetical protein B9J08_002162 [[Candida] auris]PIS56371.1 hypothetical protein CJI97_001619 [[Candida] auris]QEO21979.1 hypothetical_protein [[Candida] auris]QWW24245.1 hypothetical protein CA7LBN_003079 [[Candida] auris]
MDSWINTLPADLQAKVNALVTSVPSSRAILDDIHDYLTTTKKRKTPVQRKQPQALAPAAANNDNGPPNPYHVKYTEPVNPQEIIFQLSNLPFTSPVRKKYHLLFHLLIADNVPHPVLSIVNIANKTPELSLTGLKSAVKLCMLAPILGNSTVSSKKDTGMLCLWLQDDAAFDKTKNDPIICNINLDVVKKQLIEDGKIPPHAEHQVTDSDPDNEDAIKPINEQIIFFLQRQFSLCGIELHNFMPLARPSHNTMKVNADTAIAVSTKNDSISDFVAASAYKGSKEGSLLLLNTNSETAFMIFGFKKPILLIEFSKIRDISYKDITRFTFNMLVTIAATSESQDEVIEFSMIDQQSYQDIDDFVRRMKIQDNSFDAKLREKPEDKSENNAVEEAPQVAVEEDSDDEEEDGTYTGGVEEGDEADDSDVAEEFDSAANDSDGDMDEEDDDEDDANEDASEDIGSE